MKLIKPDQVRIKDWVFSTSVNTESEVIMIHAWNDLFQWSQVKFFDDEETAKTWVKYLVIQGTELKETKI